MTREIVPWLRLRRPATHRNGKTAQEKREDQVYYEDGKAYREVGNEWVRAPELDALKAHTGSLDNPWRTPEGAIIVAE